MEENKDLIDEEKEEIEIDDTIGILYCDNIIVYKLSA